MRQKNPSRTLMSHARSIFLLSPTIHLQHKSVFSHSLSIIVRPSFNPCRYCSASHRCRSFRRRCLLLVAAVGLLVTSVVVTVQHSSARRRCHRHRCCCCCCCCSACPTYIKTMFNTSISVLLCCSF